MRFAKRIIFFGERSHVVRFNLSQYAVFLLFCEARTPAIKYIKRHKTKIFYSLISRKKT